MSVQAEETAVLEANTNQGRLSRVVKSKRQQQFLWFCRTVKNLYQVPSEETDPLDSLLQALLTGCRAALGLTCAEDSLLYCFGQCLVCRKVPWG